jgi:NAD(P)-dependent dehydrogenase (short-subunit alcohol dehydrogenase family)
MANKWTQLDMPRLDGKRWLITGANSGLGLWSVKALAAKGANVILACRDVVKAQSAIDEVRATVPDAKLEVCKLDISSLQSVEDFAREFGDAPLDGLMNNAGIMAIPRKASVDGFEMQLATNHLGHFALTLRLLPLLEKAEAPRLIVVASSAHRGGRINFDDLMGEKSYSAVSAYNQSKLANLMFAYEAARRFPAAKLKTKTVAAHPGYSSTGLLDLGSKGGSSFMGSFLKFGTFLAQPPEFGALPQIFAAAAPEAENGAYYGPDGFLEFKGSPTRVGSTKYSRDEAVASRLWDVSEQLTKLTLASTVAGLTPLHRAPSATAPERALAP